ncbi:MAG: hypothetical protein J6J24_04865 [Clostridia bacterium]|nr:hypothetical protein [Clostridia bacterium]
MRKLTFEDFERYDTILNDKNEESDQTASWKGLKATEYVSKLAFNSFCGGSMPKIFCRTSSSLFKNLFQELRKPDCCYVTYLNDFIKSTPTTTPIDKVSVLLKKTHILSASHIEEAATIIANTLQVSTVYNKSILIDDRQYVISVDMIGKDEHFSPVLFFQSINDYTLEDCLDCLEDYLTSTYSSISNEDILQICKDFVPMYFYRKHIIKDTDFCGKNIGIIYNEKAKTHKLAPCFDMECSLKPPLIDYALEDLEKDLKFSRKRFPTLTDDLVKHYKNCLKTNAIESNLQKNVSTAYNTKTFNDFATNNLSILIDKYETITKGYENLRII